MIQRQNVGTLPCSLPSKAMEKDVWVKGRERRREKERERGREVVCLCAFVRASGCVMGRKALDQKVINSKFYKMNF